MIDFFEAVLVYKHLFKTNIQTCFGGKLKPRTFMALFRSLSELLRFHSKLAASKPIFRGSLQKNRLFH